MAAKGGAGGVLEDLGEGGELWNYFENYSIINAISITRRE